LSSKCYTRYKTVAEFFTLCLEAISKLFILFTLTKAGSSMIFQCGSGVDGSGSVSEVQPYGFSVLCQIDVTIAGIVEMAFIKNISARACCIDAVLV
jgi:hypothetical protein